MAGHETLASDGGTWEQVFMCVKVALSMILQESRVFVESVEYLIGTGQDIYGWICPFGGQEEGFNLEMCSGHGIEKRSLGIE